MHRSMHKLTSSASKFTSSVRKEISNILNAVKCAVMFWRMRRQRAANTSDLPSARMTISPSWPLLTWTCHVCGVERPDAFIGVLTRERISDLGVRFRENVRHCNDRSECAEGAKEVFFVRRSAADSDFSIVADDGHDADADYEEALIHRHEEHL